MASKSWIIVAGLVITGAAQAGQVDIIPPNDLVGLVFTTNTNDGYAGGRGVVFAVDTSTTIDSVGLFQDLTGVTLNYNVAQVTSVTGNVDAGETILRSGSALVTTSGLQFTDFSFAPLTLLAGNDYHIEFSFTGNGNQNFFYNNDNVIFTQDAFSSIDGTQNGDTSNTVMPAIRLDEGTSAVPEPGTAAISCLGLGLLWAIKRKRLAR